MNSDLEFRLTHEFAKEWNAFKGIEEKASRIDGAVCIQDELGFIKQFAKEIMETYGLSKTEAWDIMDEGLQVWKEMKYNYATKI